MDEPGDVQAAVEASALVASRERRPFALMGSLGWNSLAGFALDGSYSFTPHVAADLAVGVAAIGFKFGGRLRCNVLTSNWTPTFGVGFQYGPGSGQEITVDGQNGGSVLIVEKSAFVQGLVGMSYQGRGGFSALFGAGYAWLLDKDNIRMLSGSQADADVTRSVTGSGLVIEIALGYAFGGAQ